MTQFGRTTLRDSFNKRPAPAGSTKPKVIEYSTFLYTEPDGTLVVRQHNTDIIKTKGFNVTLDTGGWKTRTTKDRFNRYSGYQVYSDKGIWYVKGLGKTIPYYDGMVLPEAFKRKGLDRITTKQVKLTKEVNKFCKLLDTMEEVPQPSAGDCFICRMPDPDCLREHMKENYLHGTLLWNAMRSRGYKDEQIGLHYRMGLRDTFKRALRLYLKRSLQLAT